MKHIFKYITITVAALLGMVGIFTARAADDLRSEAQQTISRFLQADPGLKTLLSSSAGYAVFPGVGKGGLIIGGTHGRGLVYQQGQPIGEATLTAASIGAQAGGVSFDELILFQTPSVFQEFKAGTFTLDAQVGGVVAAEGAEARVSYQQGVAVFVLPRTGLMGGATVGGQKITFKPFAQEQP
ncbi:MAG TPA: lipid-binding SYLF domain-containing protein [Verrucomicrobiae bacterium]|nr:lipid-binding SYLF domain-containing protein [Verrucomicrobiae bacterium]